MEDAKIANGIEVFNLAGAGGTVGLRRAGEREGQRRPAMMMGLGVVGATVHATSPQATLTETTPDRPADRGVRRRSWCPRTRRTRRIDDLVEGVEGRPARSAVGGGSSPGGPDHLLPMQLAQAVGIDATTVNFVPYDGGGDLLPAILGDKVDVRHLRRR